MTYGYRERAATGLSSEDSNRRFKMSKRRSLVAKSWYIVKKVALKWSFLDGSSMSVMTRETRPSRFPEDTVFPSVAGRSKHSESPDTISIKSRTTGLTGSQLRLGGRSIDKVADRVRRNEEILLLGEPGSNESLSIPGEVSGVNRDLLFPNSRVRSRLDPLVLDVLCDDRELSLRKSDDREEEK